MRLSRPCAGMFEISVNNKKESILFLIHLITLVSPNKQYEFTLEGFLFVI